MRTTHRWQVDTGADQQQEAPTLERRPYITRPAPPEGTVGKVKTSSLVQHQRKLKTSQDEHQMERTVLVRLASNFFKQENQLTAQLEHFIQRLENGDASIFFKPIFSTLFCAHSRRWCEERGPYITKSMRQCWTDSTSARHDNHLHSESVGQLPFDL